MNQPVYYSMAYFITLTACGWSAPAVRVTTGLGITSIKVFPAISVVVYVLAPAPFPVPVWPLLLAPGPDIGCMSALESETVDVVEAPGATVIVPTVTIGL